MTHPAETYIVVQTRAANGTDIYDLPLESRILGAYPPIYKEGVPVRWRFAEAQAHAAAIQRCGKSWAIVIAAEDVPQ